MARFSAEYYDATQEKPASPLIDEALDALQATGHSALDLGSGGGRDTKHLVDCGFYVTAIDAEPLAKQYVEDLEGVVFVNATFESFNFDQYDIINATYSLPFCPPNELPGVLEKVVSALKPGGVFTGQLFGTQDEWNIPGSGRSFYTRNQVEGFFTQLEIIRLDEQITDGHLADSSAKHWHVFDVIVRKKR